MKFRSVLLCGLALPFLIVASTPSAMAAPSCVPTSGGLDYPSYLCTDPEDPKCPVYTLTTTDSGVQKRCFGVLA
jgi:hypothetical protein